MEIAGYQIKQCIAEGGMASAYLAEQSVLGRLVVLKVLDTVINDSRLAYRRFLNEGKLLAALKHPNIITIFDIGRTDDFVYISMEYVAGGDLKQRLQDGPLPPARAMDILEAVAQGLGAAHAEGIVHRDVKPGNILFRADGTPLLSDFGIAKSLYADVDLTATGVFLGSPNYMAPEQAEAADVDGRADIYSLGIILYEMLVGEKPYQSESVIDVIHMHKTAPIPRLSRPLAVYQGLLDRMLAKARSERFKDVAALIHYLRSLRASGALSVTPSAPAASANTAVTQIRWDALPNRWLRYVLYGLLGLTLVGYGVLFYLERQLDSSPRAVDPGDAAGLAATTAALQRAVPPLNTAAPLDPQAVAAAAVWLGQHSLNEQRLTTPPRDNAYYYFSRVLQLDPTNVAARNGIRAVAGAYALLAEAALDHGEALRAQAYVRLGQQIEPDNEALRLLAELTAPRQVGVVERLTRWWRRLGS
ncbi:MAG: serine/threonine protein kinase [Gammaproteobacteria bacterium]|nr:serine/threonine protein kinase [Gammaproteobacteria bacterium]